ncbi:MAG: hypothetical protein QMC78_02160 [Methanocellales archaeon]|nr:hypothetical protein [Methanocellales archaeon]
MAEQIRQDVLDNIMWCAFAIAGFNLEQDLNLKMGYAQQVNKEYHTLRNKMKAGNLSAEEVRAAVEQLKPEIANKVASRQDLSDEMAEKLIARIPSTLDQVANLLADERDLDIQVRMTFERHAEPTST